MIFENATLISMNPRREIITHGALAVEGSRIAAEEAVKAGVQAFIHMSSSAIYGAPKQHPITDATPLQPVEIYGRAKLAGEQAVRAICEPARLPLIVIRPRTILGEGRLGIFQILTNFEMDSRLVLSVLFVGQPPLRDLLRQPAHEAVTRRLVHLATLRLLSRPESHRYLAHRCTIAGATTIPFDPGAQEAVYEVACGNLRATDQLAAKALEVAHDAGAAIVDSAHLATARRLLWP